MKRKISLILALLVALTIATPFAALAEVPENTATGKIELETSEGNAFSIGLQQAGISAFQIFHVRGNESVGWTFEIHEDFADFQFEGKKGFDLINHIYSLEDEAAAHGPGIRTLTEALIQYIRANNIARTAHVSHPSGSRLSITNLPLGYYLVAGQIFASDQAHLAPFIALASTGSQPLLVSPKISLPNISLSLAEGQSNFTGVGDKVNFVIETFVPYSVLAFDDYIFSIIGEVSQFIDFAPENITLEVRIGSPNSPAIAEEGNYVLSVPGFYTGTNASTIPSDFTLLFSQSFLQNNVGNALYITYSGIANDNFRHLPFQGRYGNYSECLAFAQVRYSANLLNSSLTTMTNDNVGLKFPYFDIYKFTGSISEAHNPLGGDTGVRFALSTKPDAQNGADVDEGSLLVFTKKLYTRSEDGEMISYPYYAIAFDQESPLGENRVKHLTPDEHGYINVAGLPLGTYYLYETFAPAGYSQMLSPQEIGVYESYGSLVITPTTAIAREVREQIWCNEEQKVKWGYITTLTSAIAIQNNRSSMFPETGGIGTGIFLLAGTIIMTISATAMIIYRKHKNRNNTQDKQAL